MQPEDVFGVDEVLGDDQARRVVVVAAVDVAVHGTPPPLKGSVGVLLAPCAPWASCALLFFQGRRHDMI